MIPFAFKRKSLEGSVGFIKTEPKWKVLSPLKSSIFSLEQDLYIHTFESTVIEDKPGNLEYRVRTRRKVAK